METQAARHTAIGTGIGWTLPSGEKHAYRPTIQAKNSGKKMREDSYLLSVPLSEALELPIGVERTAQKPHAEYTHPLSGRHSRAAPMQRRTYPHKTSIAVSSLTPIEIFQIYLIENKI